MKKANSVDEYIEEFPEDIQKILQKIRKTVNTVAPQADESISYGMPAFKLNGERLIYFAAFKKHIGLFPPVPNALRNETSAYAGPKHNLQFPLGEPMPFELIKKIVKYKAMEILSK